MAFQPFDPKAPVRIYFTSLPHWRHDGCTYFVTYRLADSVPTQVIQEWDREKTDWLTAHRVKMNAEEGWESAFLSLAEKDRSAFLKHFNRKLNSYLDRGLGPCVLQDPGCSRIVVEGWEHFNGERYDLGDLVVMPNHVHLLVTPIAGHELEDILKSRKRQSAREINLLFGRSETLWQKHSFDHIVRNENALEQFQIYIEDNPTKAKLKSDQFRYRAASKSADGVTK